MITSRSDRVPLLSRRHTPAEKQNGTSDRPTDRPTLLPLLPLSSLSSPRPSSLRLFLSRSPAAILTSRNRRRVAEQREKRGRADYKSHRRRRSRKERKRKGGTRGRGESSTHLFQSSRGTRDSIREINDRTRGSGRSSLSPERPRATKRNPVSRPSDSRNEGHGKEIPSRRANRKRDWEYR